MTKIIEPKTLKGMRDFLPKQMVQRNYVMNKVKSIFELYGYDTIDTPVLEYAETILDSYGQEGNKLTYRFVDNGGRLVALRYDQTVPFARLFAANYQNLPIPFKRYQISKVWRADKPGKGRYREFYQCDIDIIGIESLLSEAEVAKIICDVFQTLGFKKFKVKFNSRKVLNSILENVKIDKGIQNSVIRVLDKKDKIGLAGVREELENVLDQKQIDNLINIIDISGSNEEKISLLSEYNFDLTDINEFLKYCKEWEIEEYLSLDLSLARGLDYYTGIVFETFIEDSSFGSLASGGRYDDLCSKFTKQKFSGVGVAFGFDRIVAVMEELQLLPNTKSICDVLIVNIDNDINNSFEVLNLLQSAGINGEIYLEQSNLIKQIKYASKKEIPFAIIPYVGNGKVIKDKLILKNIASKTQEVLKIEDIVFYIQNIKNYEK